MSWMDLPPCWQAHLGAEFDQPYMQSLQAFLQEQKTLQKNVYPQESQYFRAFEQTPLAQVRVVILGQDPYHGPGQAHGLAFSVPEGVAIPPSLRNIYKELAASTEFQAPMHGNLDHWANQGVLLLNSVLSVEAGLAASHQRKGWETFTDQVIHVVNEQCDGVVFLLWGAYAQKKGAKIDADRHCVLKAPHPSPLSAHRGFFGCDHFPKANRYLAARGSSTIHWSV